MALVSIIPLTNLFNLRMGSEDTRDLILLFSRCVRLFVTPWTAACQASLSFTISQSFLKLMSIESVMPSNHLILCRLLLLLPSIFPSIRVFSNELALCIRWPKYWSFTFSLSPSNDGHTLFCGQLRRAFSQRHSKPSPEGATRCAPHCTCRVV